jgi:hypothetical protein
MANEAVLSLASPTSAASDGDASYETSGDDSDSLDDGADPVGPEPEPTGSDVEAGTLPERSVLRMQLIGANPAVQISGVDEFTWKSNYFAGSDPANSHRDWFFADLDGLDTDDDQIQGEQLDELIDHIGDLP